MASNPFSQIKTDIIPLFGGLDLVTTPVLVPPGRLISSNNFEPDINGGYRRLPGFERYDGHTSPHDGDYWIADVVVTGLVAVTDTITGVTSGATAKVITIIDAAHLLLNKVTGTFVAETFNIGGTARGTVSAVNINSASTNALHASYKSITANDYRLDISAVPGSGYVRGVKYYQGNVYAWRDNAGGTACVMYRATPSGWTAITFGRELQFTGAVGQVSEGQTVTGATSGASAVVKRALLRTGTWTASGVGTLVFDTVTGTFQNGENIQVGGVTKVVANGADTAITLLPGGKFDFDIYNFSGSASTERLYCADGVNLAGEFDGTRWVPIRTGASVDTPLFIRGFKNQLIVAVNTDLFVSSIGAPYTWTAITGAGDIAVGEVITGIKPQTGDVNSGAMVVTTKTKIYVLYGNSTSDFNLVVYAPNNGGRAYTMQNIGFAHFLDARGVTQMVTSRAYGGFQTNILTNVVQPYVDSKLGLEISSCVTRSSNQYRVFFSDGTGLICQIIPDPQGTTAVGAAMPFDYGDVVFNTIDSVVDVSGVERIFGAATNGYVYELNVGTSFDGEVITATIIMTFNNSKSPRLRKRYRRSVLQFRAGSTAHIGVGYDLSYGDYDTSFGDSDSRTIYGAGGFWESFTWENFVWDSAYAQQITLNTVGSGENVAIIVTNESDMDEPFTIHTCFLHYTQGRLNR